MLLITEVTLLAAIAAAYPQHHTRPAHDQSGWTTHDLIGLGPRQEHGVAALNNQIYILGGVLTTDEGELQTVNRVESYRIADSTWHVAAPIPQVVNHANVTATASNLYILGSLSGGGNWSAQDESFVYHPTNDSWNSLAPLPAGTARGSSAVGVWHDTIILAGGMTFLDITGTGLQDSIATVSVYNTTSNTWNTEFPPLPHPRQHVGGAVVDDTFYVLGGRESGIEQIRDTVYALDLRNPTTWTTLAPMPTA